MRDKKIILTFDDGLKSHYTKAFKLMQHYGFKGTFFYTPSTPIWKEETEAKISHCELLEMHKKGMEIGNHTLTHKNLLKISPTEIKKEIIGLEKYLEKIGIPKPKSFCYPGYGAGEISNSILLNLGYKIARIGYSNKGHATNKNHKSRKIIHYYEFGKTNSNWIRCTGIMNEEYDFDYFKKDVENMPENSAAVFCIHSLENFHIWDYFQKSLEYMKNNNYETICLNEIKIKKSNLNVL